MNYQHMTMYKYIFYFFSLLLPVRLSFYFDGSTRYFSSRAILVSLLLYFIVTFISTKKIKLHLGSISVFLIFSLISTLYAFIWIVQYPAVNDNYIGAYVNIFVPVFGFVFLLEITSKLKLGEIITGAKLFTIVSLLLITVDTYIRFTYPDYAFKGDMNNFSRELELGSLYIYKYGSIMYFDSNYVANHILVVIVLAYFSFSVFTRNIIITSFIILLFLTFSRAAYLGFILLCILHLIFTVKYKYKSVLLLMLTIISMPICIYFFTVLSLNDPSLNTKFLIFKDMFSKIETMDITSIMFGSGFDIGGYLFSWKEGGYAHSLVPLLIGEVGFIGCVIYFLILSVVYFKVGRPSLLVMLVAVFVGMSLIYPYDTIYLYVLMVIYTLYERRRKHELS